MPEKLYRYFAPDFPLPDTVETQAQQVEYLPNAKPGDIPESTYHYYSKSVPDEVLEHKNEPLKVPIQLDPEKRFQYYRPTRAVPPGQK